MQTQHRYQLLRWIMKKLGRRTGVAMMVLVMMVIQYNTHTTTPYESPLTSSRVSKYLPYIVLPLVEEMLLVVGENMVVVVVGPVSKNEYMVLSPPLPPLQPTAIYYTYSTPPSEEWSYLPMGRQGKRGQRWKSENNNEGEGWKSDNNNNNDNERKGWNSDNNKREGWKSDNNNNNYNNNKREGWKDENNNNKRKSWKSDNNNNKWGSQLTNVSDYFRYLHTPQFPCRKLVRMGGIFACGEERYRDGQKYVCMDIPLSLPTGSRDPSHCLTLSYGIQFDTTFDEAASDLPCEVHMFDVMPFYPDIAEEEPHVHFHQEGLAASHHSLFYQKLNMTAVVNTLSGHVNKLALYPRLIHILKIDIDGGEWDVLKNLAQDPILDAVGQVAMEVHVVNLVMSGTSWSTQSQVSRENWLRALQEKYQILRLFESRGFRRVVYWDNVQDKFALYEKDGARHETAGELLYVNTNWYRDSFRTLLRTRGYNISTLNAR